MKNLIKLIALFAIGIGVQAQQFYSTNNLAATNHTIFASGAVIQQITLWSTNASPTMVYLRDGDLTYTNGVYTNFLRYTTNVISSYVGASGITNNQTNVNIVYVPQTIAANTNNTPVRATITVPASGVILTYPFDPNLLFTKKLTLSNSAVGLNAVIQYRVD